ncbi:MAG: hypothetical protein JXJ04_22950 [Spirochaetales bacterium]|nr:hypothetical protein [Spirochaetales bacterium]
MSKKNTILLYGRSTLNLIISIITVGLIASSMLLFKDAFRIIVPVVIFFSYLVITIKILSSKHGAKEILIEQEEDRINKVNKIITQYREMRDRIAFLRIGDEEVKKAINFFLLISGNYFNKCKELLTYSPEANRKIEEILELCQIYLEEYDEEITEIKFNMEDDDRVEQYKERTVKAIFDAAEIIKNKMKDDFSGITRSEKFEIIEEMNSE